MNNFVIIPDDEYFFLDYAAKVQKIAPLGWKDPGKQRVGVGNFVLYLRVKYYAEKAQHLK